MQAQARVVEPLGQRDGGAAIAVVEVVAHGEHLDRLEAVRGDLDEVIAIEPIADVEMGGDSEHFSQTRMLGITTTARAARAGARTAGTSRGSPSRSASVRGMY